MQAALLSCCLDKGRGGRGERRTRRGGEEERLEQKRGGGEGVGGGGEGERVLVKKEKGSGKGRVGELEECHNSLQIGEADVQSLTWPCTVPFEVWREGVCIGEV